MAHVPITPIILCGGAGVRLWPLSRESAPKPFLPLVDGRSTFALTLDRVSGSAMFAPPVVVTNETQRHPVVEALAAAGVTGEILLEPARRDSAAAIAAAAMLAAKRDPDALVLVLAADHVIRDVDGFRRSVATARQAAEKDYIVTFGVRPDTPATQYGYIRPGAALTDVPDVPDVAIVAEFAEKPEAATARSYVDAGYLWNSGNFMMRAALAGAEVARHAPEIAEAVGRAVEGIVEAPPFLRLPEKFFAAAPAMSFDYAVMEKTDRAAVVEADFDWRDIGSWDSIREISEADKEGNTKIGDVVAMDVRRSHLHARNGVVAALGVEDVVVAASGGAVLVAARDRIGSLKDLVADLEAFAPATGEARHVSPWGYFESIGRGAGYQVKRIVVDPGARLSLQKHAHRAEHWVVVAGTADATVGEEVRRLEENQSVFIPLGSVHRLANPGKIPLTVIEVQYGDYLGEDDIVRLDDDYARGNR